MSNVLSLSVSATISKISLEIWERGWVMSRSQGRKRRVPHPNPRLPTHHQALLHCERKRDIPAWLHAGVTDNRGRETLPRCSFRQIICWWQHVSLVKTLHCFSLEASVAAALTKHSPGKPSLSAAMLQSLTCWCVFEVFLLVRIKQKQPQEHILQGHLYLSFQSEF